MDPVLPSDADPRSDTIAALRQVHRRPGPEAAPSIPRATAQHDTLREARLDRIEAAKRRHWRTDLRMTQIVYVLLIGLSIGFLTWQDWAFWAAGIGVVVASTGMWLFARRMRPREERLRRHIVALARRRRTCADCGYRLQGLPSGRCPECGTEFDPQDNRHILSQQTLHVFSGRARQVSTVIIVFVIFWLCALSNGSGWPVQVALAGGLLVAFHVLHAVWIGQARKLQDRFGPPPSPMCPDCGVELATQRQGLPQVCSGCGRRLTYGDLYIRPDAHWLADRRVLAMQYRSLMLRWVFLLVICGGTVGLVQFSDVFRRLVPPRLTGSMFGIVLAIPIIVYVVLASVAFRGVARRLQRGNKMLLSQVHPQCRGCNADLAGQPAGEPCPQCGRKIGPADVCG